MCGIGGALFVDDAALGRPPPIAARTMRERLRHRGPDGDGVYVDDGVWLAHTRLALVDEQGGAQPLTTPDGRFALIVNGEVYGHRRRRALLTARGAAPRTHSDAEVLLWSLVLDGPGAVASLEGEYAFCLYDRVARRAWLGRDLLGVKPLVYARRGRGLWFSSEAQALRAVAGGHAVDLFEVARTFACPPLAGRDQLPFLGLQSAPAGAVLEVTEGGVRTVVTRRPPAVVPRATTARDGDLAAALANAVADRLDADVPVGAFLSGGIDSTAIVGAALAAGAPTPFPCFTIRSDGGRAAGSIVVGDDGPFVDALARAWPLAVTRVGAGDDAERLGVAEGVWRSQDRVAAWEQELSQRRLAIAARVHVKAVLVGDAADETHGGYAFLLQHPTCSHPRAFVERFGGTLRRELLRPQLRSVVDDVVDDALAVAAAAAVPFGAAGGTIGAARAATTAVIQARWLPRLLHNGDVHTMAVGLEARVPFADERVVALADAVAIDEAYNDDDAVPEKRVLRRAVRALVPASVLARRKSALPRDEVAGPAWRALLATRLANLDARERLAAVFDLDAVAALLTRDPADDAVRAALFSTVSVEAFLRYHS